MKLTKTVRNRLILVVAFAISFAVVLTLASFFDLAINTAIYSPDNFFGQVVSNIGEMPAYIAIVVAAVILYQCVDESDRHFILYKILAGVVLIVGSYFLVANVMSNLSTDAVLYQPAYCIFFGAAISVLSVLATNKANKRVMRKLALFAVFLLIVAALSQGIVFVMKYVGGRLRFRNMVDGIGFTPWYDFQFGTSGREGLVAAGSFQPDDAFKSFPSGHTANSAILFTLVFLPNIFLKMKKLKPFFFGFAAVWTVMVAFARMTVGAHFLSDVLVGGTVTVTVTAAAKWIIEAIYKKRGKSMTYGDAEDDGEYDNRTGSAILAVEFPSESSEASAESKPEITPDQK